MNDIKLLGRLTQTPELKESVAQSALVDMTSITPTI